jgi:L,D-transpeptidase ErfK/SrfK
MVRRVKWFCSLLVILSSQCALAVSYPLPPEGSRLVGSPQRVTVPHNNTQPLEAFAAQYGQGLSNMLEANPGVDVFLPKSGTTLVIPQQLILPDTVREGIVVNVAEMRLYYYPPEGNTVEVLPIGIGQAGRETPRNWVTTVERKQEAPTWTPTANTRREYARRGESLPASFRRGRIIQWGCTQFISAGCTRFMAPMPILVSGCASVRDAFAYVMTISNICSITSRLALACRLSIGR